MGMAAFAVLFIGLSKAGFGGGLGMLTTPICVMAFGPKDAIGILLPLLCAGDAHGLNVEHAPGLRPQVRKKSSRKACGVDTHTHIRISLYRYI